MLVEKDEARKFSTFTFQNESELAIATYLVPRWSQGVTLRARRPPARHFASFSPVNIRISSKV